MLAQTELSPLLTIEAKIQSRIGKFLLLKEKLMKLMKSPIITVRDKATLLMMTQDRLQEELRKALNSIEVMKQGVWSFSDITGLGTFYYEMEKQIRDVDKLESEASTYVPAETTTEKLAKYAPWIFLIGASAAVVTALKRR